MLGKALVGLVAIDLYSDWKHGHEAVQAFSEKMKEPVFYVTLGEYRKWAKNHRDYVTAMLPSEQADLFNEWLNTPDDVLVRFARIGRDMPFGQNWTYVQHIYLKSLADYLNEWVRSAGFPVHATAWDSVTIPKKAGFREGFKAGFNK